MDKPLPDKEQKQGVEPGQDTAVKNDAPQAAPATEKFAMNTGNNLSGKVSIGAYGPNSNLSEKAWNESQKAWNSTPQGRLAIRAFSRGIMGAAFFTAGSMLTRHWLHSDPHWNTQARTRYYAYDPLSKQDNPLKIIAKVIDTVVGEPIKFTVKHANLLSGSTIEAAERAAEEAVRFRPTKFKGLSETTTIPKGIFQPKIDPNTKKEITAAFPEHRRVRGRSLGNEAVSITFDFFCASVGDAWGRDIAAWIDPNVTKKWIKEDKNKDGKVVGHHIDVPAAAKQAMKSVFQYITYNGGEDWAVAIPYAYYMKAQRAVINQGLKNPFYDKRADPAHKKHWIAPGYKYDFDRGLNGNSTLVTDHNNPVGNFTSAGAVDLQGRFTVYNIGTLMYREVYDYASNRLQGKKASLYGAADKPENKHGILGIIGNGLKWMARSIVKGGIYMTPAVPFFWVTRATQGKERGIFIHPEMGILTDQQVKNNKDKYETIFKYDNFVHQPGENEKSPLIYYSHFDDATGKFVESDPISRRYLGVVSTDDPKMRPSFYEGPHYGTADAIVSKVGEFNSKIAVKVGDMTGDWAEQYALKHMPYSDPLVAEKYIGEFKNRATTFGRTYVNAAFSYTPYMYAKAEAARLWDDGKMDMSIERMIDGASRLNLGEFKAGAGEVWRSFLHKPLADPLREQEAERRKHMDTSPPADVTRNGHGDQARDGDKASWRERIVQGTSTKSEKKVAKKAASHAEQEEMRKALDGLTPPTNSIH